MRALSEGRERPGDGAGESAAASGDDVERRRAAVRSMFNRVSERYDLLNRLLSLGMDGWWRRTAVKAMRLRPGDRALDVACGTGDLSLEAARSGTGGIVAGVDFAHAMLEIGRRKSAEKNGGGAIRYVNAAAEMLPFGDGVFAASAAAFGIRNVPRRAAALAEMARTVRPGGRVVVLELTTSARALSGRLVRAYTRAVIPLVGAFLSRGDAYRYLTTSMDSFPEPEEFAREMGRAGLVDISARQMFLSPAWVFSGTVPEASPRR